MTGNGIIADTAWLNINLRTGLTPEDHSLNISTGGGRGRFENGRIFISSADTVAGFLDYPMFYDNDARLTEDLFANGDDFVGAGASGLEINAVISKPGGADPLSVRIAAFDKAARTFRISQNDLTITNAYNNGTIEVNGVAMDIDAVDLQDLRLFTVQSWQPVRFVLQDDDSPPGTPIPLPDTSRLEPAFKPAFIIPRINNLPGGGETLPFIANVQGQTSDEVSSYWKFDNTIHRSQSFWVAYIFGAFQGNTYSDMDPDSEDLVFGRSVGLPSSSTSGFYSKGGVNVYMEAFIESTGWLRPNLTGIGYRVEDTVVHEIGHLFDCQHIDSGVMGNDGEWPDGAAWDSIDFKPSSLNRIRNRDYP